MSAEPISRILITGMPGVGKTTIVKKLAGDLSAVNFTGFFTEEVRDASGVRKGFDIESFDGQRSILARDNGGPGPTVGKYTVFVKEFEKVALPIVTEATGNLLIDEIGKMELMSMEFGNAIERILMRKIRLIATVPMTGHLRIVEGLKKPGHRIFVITKSNRDEVYGEILAAVRDFVVK